jgi:hypothetical protein
MKQLFTMTAKLLLFIPLLCCHKDALTSNTPSREYFPNTVGDSWEYDVYDSSVVRDHPNFPRGYTVKLVVTGIQKLVDGKDATVWQYQYPWGNDTNFVRIIDDSIKVFDAVYSREPRNLDFPRQMFLPPFQVGKRWDGKLLYIDSSRVMNRSNIITPTQTFPDCFDIYHHYLGPNLEYNDHYWFKPNIGMTRISYNQYTLGFYIVVLWQLKKYSLR